MSLIVTTVIRELTEAGLPAETAYPGTAMPNITQPQMAVNLQKLDFTARSATVQVTVMVPVRLGGGICEETAIQAGAVLERLGGTVTMEECRFNAYADAYYIRVLGDFFGAAVLTGWSAASEFTVEVDDTVLNRAVSFRAEQAVDQVTGTPLSTAVWTFRLEEKFGWGEGPLPGPNENFTVIVSRNSGMEIYEECSWTSVQLEDTTTGLRQVRTGVAKRRSFMAVA